MTHSPLFGGHWLEWVRNFTLRVGILTGAYLTAVMVISVLAATRVPFLEPFANFRNAAAYAAFAFFMLIPAVCFLRKPVQLFFSGMCGWVILSLGYAVMGMFFDHLHTRLRFTPFHLFILGALLYGLAAVVSWVLGMALSLRQQTIAARHRRP